MKRAAVSAILVLGLFALTVRGDGVTAQLFDKQGVPIRAASLEAGHKVVDKKPLLSIPASKPNSTYKPVFHSEPAEPLNLNNAIGDAAISTTNSVYTNGLLAMGALTGLKEAVRARANDPAFFEAGHKVVDKKPELFIPAISPNKTSKGLFSSEPAEPLNLNNAVGDAAVSTKNSIYTNGLLGMGALTGLKEALRARINDPGFFEAGRKVTEATRLNTTATVIKTQSGQVALAIVGPKAASGFGGALLPQVDGMLSMFSGKQAKAPTPAPAPAPAPAPVAAPTAKGAAAQGMSLTDKFGNLFKSEPAEPLNINNAVGDAAMSTYNSLYANGLLMKSAATGLSAFGMARANDGIGKGLSLFGGRRAGPAPAPKAAEAPAAATATAQTGTVNEAGPAQDEKLDHPTFQLPHMSGSKPRVACPAGYDLGNMGKCVKESQRQMTQCYMGPACSAGYNETAKVVLNGQVQELVAGAMALKKAGLGIPQPLQALLSSAVNGTTSAADLAAAREALGQHITAAAKAKGKDGAFAGFEARDMVDAGAKLLAVPWTHIPDVAKLSATVTRATKAVPPHLLGDVKAVAPKTVSHCCKSVTETQQEFAAPTLVCDKGTLDILKYRCQ